MILRGAQLSESRQALPLGAVAAPVEQRPAGKLVQMLMPTNAIESPPPAAVIERPRETPATLTFETVVAWLAVQDETTKHDCAAILATQVGQIYEHAKREGFAEGRTAAETAAKKELDAWLNTLKAISDAAEQELADQSARLEDQCVEVIAEAIAKIAGPLLGTGDAAIGAVREILKRVRESREITIRVAREDVDAIKRWQGSLSEALGGHPLEIVADSRVELGGALVETKLGSLDGRFEVQLRELYETLRLAKSAQVAAINKESA